MKKDETYYVNQAIVHHQAHRFDKALIGYNLALKCNPNFIPAIGNRAEVLYRLKRYAESRKDFEVAMAAAPQVANGWFNYSVLLAHSADFEAALDAAEKAIKYEPKMSAAWHSKANILREIGNRDEEALVAYDESIRLDPQNYSAITGRAWTNLRAGRWTKENWDEFDMRLLAYPEICPGFPGATVWKGEPLNGTKLYVVAEQGIGDVLMFSRLVKALKDRGENVSFVVWERLAAICKSLDLEVVYGRYRIEKPFKWIPMMSLMGAMGLTVETIPDQVPYLRADQKRIETWRTRLSKDPKAFRIGLCWSPGHEHLHGYRARDIPLQDFRQFWDNVNGPLQLISLQKGPGTSQLKTIDFLVEDYNHDPDNKENFFMDTAAIMKNLDLVISTDTSVIHMAGALGVPCMMPAAPGTCWRWLLDIETCPWYPSLKIYRQTAHRKWDDVFARMIGDINASRK